MSSVAKSKTCSPAQGRRANRLDSPAMTHQQPAPTRPQEPQRRALRLEECGDVLTLPELAAVLQLSIRSVRRRLECRLDLLPPALPRDGRRWTWARHEVEGWLHCRTRAQRMALHSRQPRSR